MLETNYKNMQAGVQRRPDGGKFMNTQVRIKVAAAALNFADVLILKGAYQERPRLPFTPGSEVSGRVIEVGAGVAHVRAGDCIVALVGAAAAGGRPGGSGGFAEEAVAQAASTFRLPLLGPSGPEADADLLAAAVRRSVDACFC